MEANQEYEVLVLVEAETPQLARENAVGELMVKVVSEGFSINGFSLSYLVPVQTTSDEGHTLLRDMWLEYLTQCVHDLSVLVQALAPHMADREPPVEVLESMAVRSACLRLGTIDTWPIRIYHLGLGVINTDHLEELMHTDSLWVVTAQVKGI